MATDYYYAEGVYRNSGKKRSDYERKKIIKKTQKIKTKKNIKNLALLTVILLMIFVLIFSYGKLMEVEYDLGSTETRLQKLQNDNSSLKADIEKQLDLKQLKIYAENELNMISPDDNQIVFMDVSLNDKTISCAFDTQESNTVELLLNIFK